ncbi:MAG: TonB-dependent receptor plug domain-containing protein, partial [Mangrovibacterium sp.]|nr:TonB-dependent receptor plug domain-containing protein [Mangrovibacterium sp.]
MKLTFFILMACLMQVSATVYSQATKFSFNVQGRQVFDVLKEIEDQSDFRFVYQREQVDVTKKVDLNVTDETVETILKKLFVGQDISCRVLQDNLIVIMPGTNGQLGTAQQSRPVSGKVTDSSGAPLPGVTVVIEGTNSGTVTGVDGSFSLSNVSDKAVLVFSFVGMKTQELPVEGKRSVHVVLVEDAIGIEEVVAIGYGTARKRDVTGAISRITGESIKEYKSGSVLEAMGGKVAGVQITSTDGTPGGGFNIQIRGVGTITGNTSPLYVVDGFQVSDIDYLSSTDIENIEILKDASAAAIYGARAANGVVLVTTKSGKTGRPSVNYNGSTTYTTMNKYLDVLSPYEFVKLQSEFGEAYQDRYFIQGNNSEGIPYKYQSLEDYRGVKGVDWQKELFKSTWSRNHDLSVQGGNADTKYSFG